MKNGLQDWLRQFFHRKVMAKDPLPQKSSPYEQDMPRQQRSPVAPVSAPAVAQVPPLRGRHSAYPHLQASGRLKGRRAARVRRTADPSGVNEQV